MLALVTERVRGSAPTSPAPSPAAPGRPTTLIVASGVAATVFAVGMVTLGWRDYHDPWLAFLLAQTVGLAFVAAGLIAWWHRPDNRIGPLMVAGGASWYLSHLQDSGIPVLFALGYWLTYLDLVVYAHLALVYPHGRSTTRAQRWLVAAGYAAYLVLQGARYVAEGHDPVGWDPSRITAWANVLSVNGLLFNAVVCAIIVRRWAAASGSARRVHAPVWLAILYTDAILIVGTAISFSSPPGILRKLIVLAYGLGLVAVPFAFLSGLLRVRLAHVRVSELVVKLQRATDPGRLRDLLAEALDDPTLVLGFWSDDEAGYVDADGRPVTVPDAPAGRGVTPVGEHDQRLAVLVHDPALAQQPSLVRAAVAAARLGLENARLQAVLRAQLAELHASRSRIAQAALDERRRIERDLHDGVQQRLLRLSWLAKRAATAAADNDAVAAVLDQLADEARTTHTELRELAQGIHPAILTENGLAVAVEEYAVRAPVAVRVEIPRDRWAPAVESTAFFVILEAVANAAKYAGVSDVRVRAREESGRLAVEVRDGGAGGADPRRGTGLRGLGDRVGALGGTLTVDSSPGRGTTVRAELPCG